MSKFLIIIATLVCLCLSSIKSQESWTKARELRLPGELRFVNEGISKFLLLFLIYFLLQLLFNSLSLSFSILIFSIFFSFSFFICVNEGVAHDDKYWYFSNAHFLYKTTVKPVTIMQSNHAAIPGKKILYIF
jgi:hypothetical protein